MTDRTVDTPPHRGAAVATLAAVLALVVASFWSLDLRLAGLWGEGAGERLARFVAGFWPPAVEPAFLAQVGRAALETFAMSLLGTALAAAAGLVLALPASLRRDGWVDAPRTWSAWRTLARLGLNALRAVPELVWAALLLVAAGLGPLAGTLALALHTTGVLGRLFADAVENAPPGPAAALRWRGVGPLRVFAWAQAPQIAPQLLSYSLYRWENNIRAAAVLGVVGAGGLGQMLSVHLGLFQLREAGTVLGATMALVLCVDGLSVMLRRLMLR